MRVSINKRSPPLTKLLRPKEKKKKKKKRKRKGLIDHILAHIPKHYILKQKSQFGNNASVIFGIDFKTNQKIVVKFISKMDECLYRAEVKILKAIKGRKIKGFP